MSRTATVLALVLAALTGCSVASVETRDPAAIPDGSLEAQGAEATGPIVEVGSGTLLGLGWRYAVFPSEDGWCTQLETNGVTSAGCGDILPAGERAFGSVGRGAQVGAGVTVIEGIATEQTATVWLIAEGGGRSPATLMPLTEAALDAQAFLGFVPADATITHVMAVAFNGEVLETYEMP